MFACIITIQGHSQYYLRGTVTDESGKAIYNAKIFLSTKGTVPFYTGTTGSFGIPISVDLLRLRSGRSHLHRILGGTRRRHKNL